MEFEAGERIQLTRYAHVYEKDLNISELVSLSAEEVQGKEDDSVKKEQAIFNKIQSLLSEWNGQAEETIHLRKALEYLRTLPPQHTSNQWQKMENNWIERSNMVYKMSYRIQERPCYGTGQKPPPICWELTWNLFFNTPRNPNYHGSGAKIAGQRDKKFTEKSDMEKYLNGRIKAYAHLFTEISPPIPKEHQKQFWVNGVLLPGYTVEAPEHLEPNKGQVDDLLSFLLDEDIDDNPPKQPSTPQEKEKTLEAVWSRNRQHRQKKKTTLER